MAVNITALPAGTLAPVIGIPYFLQLRATDSADATPNFSWTLVSGSLPPGLSLSSGGVISGTPLVSTADQTFEFQVQATNLDDGAFAFATLTMTVGPGIDVIITAPTLSDIEVFVPFSKQFTAVDLDDPTPVFTWSVVAGSLPVTTAFSAAGVWDGELDTLSAWTFTIRALNINNGHTGFFILRGKSDAGGSVGGNINITTPVLAPRDGVGFEINFDATDPQDASPNFTWSITAGTLPPGTTFDAAGLWSGTVVGHVGETFTFTVHVINSDNGNVGSRTYSVTISPLLSWWEVYNTLWNFVYVVGTTIYRITAAQVGQSGIDDQQNGLFYFFKSTDGGFTYSLISSTGDPAHGTYVTPFDFSQSSISPVQVGDIIYLIGWKPGRNLIIQPFNLATETWLPLSSLGPSWTSTGIPFGFSNDINSFYGLPLPDGRIAIAYPGPADAGPLQTPYLTIYDPGADTWTAGTRIFSLGYTTQHMIVRQGIQDSDRAHFFFASSDDPYVNGAAVGAASMLHYAYVLTAGTIGGQSSVGSLSRSRLAEDISFPAIYSPSGVPTIAVACMTRTGTSGQTITGMNLFSSPVQASPSWTTVAVPNIVTGDNILPYSSDFSLTPTTTLVARGSLLDLYWSASSIVFSQPAWTSTVKVQTFDGSSWSGLTTVVSHVGSLVYGSIYTAVLSGTPTIFYVIEDADLFLGGSGFQTKFFGLLPFGIPIPPEPAMEICEICTPFAAQPQSGEMTENC